MKKKIIAIAVAASFVLTSFTGCREANRARYNVQKEADYFNVERRLSVINARTDKPVLEVIIFLYPITAIMNSLSRWKLVRTNTRWIMFT